MNGHLIAGHARTGSSMIRNRKSCMAMFVLVLLWGFGPLVAAPAIAYNLRADPDDCPVVTIADLVLYGAVLKQGAKFLPPNVGTCLNRSAPPPYISRQHLSRTSKTAMVNRHRGNSAPQCSGMPWETIPSRS